MFQTENTAPTVDVGFEEKGNCTCPNVWHKVSNEV